MAKFFVTVAAVGAGAKLRLEVEAERGSEWPAILAKVAKEAKKEGLEAGEQLLIMASEVKEGEG